MIEKCSFCGLDKSEVLALVSGVDAYICNNCIEKVYEIVISSSVLANNNINSISHNNEIKIKKPKEIKQYLDEYIIGQDNAKKAISVAVYNHYKRLSYNKKENDDDIEIEKSNLILIGNTGTGKTLIAKTVSKLLDVPFTIVDATVFTEAGYVGEDVESILSRLLQVSDYDVKKAEKGIVFIDEIDKIARKSDNPSITRDVSGEGVQQGLLKLLEGAIVKVPPQGGRKHPDQKMIEINTKDILFIAGGAFDGINRIISSRINTTPLGFSNKNNSKKTDEKNIFSFINHQDLKKFGLIPELIGRFPIISSLAPLDKYTLKKIITEPKNAIIKQYKKLFKIDNIDFSIDEQALDFIVDKALDYKLGARGLRSICEEILSDFMFDFPDKKNIKSFTLTKEIAENKIEKLLN